MVVFDDTHTGSLVKGNIDAVKEYCIKHEIREIYFALPDKSEALNDLAKFADDHFIHFGLVQEVTGMSYQKFESHTYDNIPVISYDTNKNSAIRPELYRKAFYKLLKQ